MKVQMDAVVGENVAVVLDVLAQLFVACALQPGFQARQHFVQRQLRGRVRPFVRQRNVGGLARPHGQRNAHQPRGHFVQRRGFGVDGREFGGADFLQPFVKSGPVLHGGVAHPA